MTLIIDDFEIDGAPAPPFPDETLKAFLFAASSHLKSLTTNIPASAINDGNDNPNTASTALSGPEIAARPKRIKLSSHGKECGPMVDFS